MEFVHHPIGVRVVFGAGTLDDLGAEVARLDIERALVITRRVDLDESWVAGRFDGAAMHVPQHVADRARSLAQALDADGLVAIGGGSTIGVAKAVALQTALPIVAVPTTYAGSEMPGVWGLTRGGVKTTGQDVSVQPRTVIYDPELTASLPPDIAGASLMNALAHAVEALYSEGANPIVSILAEEGIRQLAAGARTSTREPSLLGAHLAATALGSVDMALHHKLCHVLGGTFGLPHAQTHAVLLPYAAAFNESAAREAMERTARALGVPKAPLGLYELARSLGTPSSLEELGLSEHDLDRAAEVALSNSYRNPRPLTRKGIRRLLDAAYHGREPAHADVSS